MGNCVKIEYRLPYVVYVDCDTTNIVRKEMWRWCRETFGADYTVWSHDSVPDYLGVFYFCDEARANWFIMRWM